MRGTSALGIGVVAALVASILGVQPAVAAIAPARPAVAATPTQPAVRAASLQVGTVTLRRCDLGVQRTAWCGSIRVRLDYADPASGLIRVGFGWLPSSWPARGTVVAQEGGPGYPSTGTTPDFVQMLGGLLRTRNLLVVDARGTGRSSAIDCEPLQSLPAPSRRFRAAVTACGNQLNHTYRRAGGGWVHASDLFTTANSARDLAHVIRALDVAKVDLYGDSYGTYFAQAFLARFPNLMRSVVLDSAYEARDLDPWYRTTVTTARAAFDTVCRRAIGCAAGSSWRRITRLARLLRRHPISGRVVGTDAALHRVTVDITALVNIVNDAGYDYEPYRQLDAAARAYLAGRDATPLLRLYAQDVGYDYSDYYADASYYSDGLYMAVACTDYPQLFDMRSSPRQRRHQLAASIQSLPSTTFAPFTRAEWLRVLPYTETYSGCLTWPKPTSAADPPVPPGVPMDRGDVPVLILNGELDSLTPAAGRAHIARQIGPAAQAYVAANTVHLVALDSVHNCGPRLVRQFIAAPARQLDTACLAGLPPVRAVPAFPATVQEVKPAAGRAPRWIRALATVAAAESGDALIRYEYVDGNLDLGLRGGTVRYTDAGDASLHAVKYTRDTTTTGMVRASDAGGSATVTVTAAGRTARFALSWGRGRIAHIVSGRYRLTTPAP